MSRILIIDDEPLVCEAFQITLEQAGHVISTAANGLEGLALWRSAKFDLVITDILMPEMEGIDLIHQIRHSGVPARIIAVTGGARLRNVDLIGIAKKYGADYAFPKPIDRRQLMVAVNECLDKPTDRAPMALA